MSSAPGDVPVRYPLPAGTSFANGQFGEGTSGLIRTTGNTLQAVIDGIYLILATVSTEVTDGAGLSPVMQLVFAGTSPYTGVRRAHKATGPTTACMSEQWPMKIGDTVSLVLSPSFTYVVHSLAGFRVATYVVPAP